jgi:exopolysaccharide biosynthesis WecB/TagA/CpsF family protein
MQAVSIVGAEAPLPVGDLLAGRTQILSFANSHAINLACTNPEFLELLLGADLLYRDGVGMRLLFQWAGLEPGRNMNGTDFIPKVLAASGGVPVALYGSTGDVAAAAAKRLQRDGVNVTSSRDGFLSIAEYATALRVDRPRVVVLGMGMPKQEIVAQHLREATQEPVLIVNGGAILDFLANRFPRAPLWIRNVGLEWLFRLLLEPRRLWRRYVLGNAIFIARAARVAIAYRFRSISKRLDR